MLGEIRTHEKSRLPQRAQRADLSCPSEKKILRKVVKKVVKKVVSLGIQYSLLCTVHMEVQVHQVKFRLLDKVLDLLLLDNLMDM